MQNNFKNLSDQLFKSLNKEEILTLSLSGESSHFCRLNQSKDRNLLELGNRSPHFSSGKRFMSSQTNIALFDTQQEALALSWN